MEAVALEVTEAVFGIIQERGAITWIREVILGHGVERVVERIQEDSIIPHADHSSS
jgi:hypothetical protein